MTLVPLLCCSPPRLHSGCYVNISITTSFFFFLTYTQQKQTLEAPVETGEGAEKSPPSETAEADSDDKPTKVDPNSESSKTVSDVISDYLPTDAPKARQFTPSGHGGNMHTVKKTNTGLTLIFCVLVLKAPQPGADLLHELQNTTKASWYRLISYSTSTHTHAGHSLVSPLT